MYSLLIIKIPLFKSLVGWLRFFFFFILCFSGSHLFDHKNNNIQVKSSFIVIPLQVWTYSGTRCRASQDHGAT